MPKTQPLDFDIEKKMYCMVTDRKIKIWATKKTLKSIKKILEGTKPDLPR